MTLLRVFWTEWLAWGTAETIAASGKPSAAQVSLVGREA